MHELAAWSEWVRAIIGLTAFAAYFAAVLMLVLAIDHVVRGCEARRRRRRIRGEYLPPYRGRR